MWLQTLLASGAALLASTTPDPFEGYKLREVLSSPRPVSEVERCIIAASVAAYPTRYSDGSHEVLFLSSMQTLSGRNPPLWRLVVQQTGSRLEVYDGKRQLKRARHCFASQRAANQP